MRTALRSVFDEISVADLARGRCLSTSCRWPTNTTSSRDFAELVAPDLPTERIADGALIVRIERRERSFGPSPPVLAVFLGNPGNVCRQYRDEVLVQS